MRPADFRSDTVTRPSEAMRAFMASAPVGDDVLGDDPTVKALEEEAAALLGTEAALFVTSGTMGNQIAIRIHSRAGDELIAEDSSHVVLHEQGGAAQLWGVSTRALRGQRGRLDPREVERAIRVDDPHDPRTSMVAVENTHASSGGSVVPLEALRELRELTTRRHLALHLDGARLWNACAATGIAPSTWCAEVDTVSTCLSKGLGAPVGAVLGGTRPAMREAQRVRKVLGGGMRQAGVIAAGGLYALRHLRERLVEDHARASRLAAGLRERTSLDVIETQTNIVLARKAGRAEAWAEALRAGGVLVLTNDADTLRFVTHLDVDDRDVDHALEVAAAIELIERGR